MPRTSRPVRESRAPVGSSARMTDGLLERALANKPSVILADEPTGALDSRTGREVLGILRDLHEKGNTVVLITHDNSIAATAERVIRLEDGKVVFDGQANDPASGVHREEAAGNAVQ